MIPLCWHWDSDDDVSSFPSSTQHLASCALLLNPPIVYVFPDPVCPYASTVALYPVKRPSTKGLTQSENIDFGSLPLTSCSEPYT